MHKHDHMQVHGNKNSPLFGVNSPMEKKCDIRLKNELVGLTLKALQCHVGLDPILFSCRQCC